MNALPVASGRETRRALWHLARPHRGLMAGGLAILLAATTASLSIPYLLGGLVDVVLGNRPEGDLDGLVALLVLATALQGVLLGLGAWAVGRFGELILAELREEVVDRALAVPVGDIERAGTGDLVARACGDVDAVSEAMREAIPEILASALIIGLTVVGLAALDWRLALAGLAATPVQILATRWYLRRSRPLYAAERAAEGLRSQRLHQSVTGARTIRSLRLQAEHLTTLHTTSREAVDLAVRAAGVRARFFSALNGAELVGLAAVLIVSFPLVRDDTITVGAATAAALYFYRLFDPIGGLLSQLDTAQAAGAALARLIGVTSLPTPSRPDGAVGGRSVDVRLSSVSFSYDEGNEVLRQLDLTIAPGERVALVGPSGAGKTTVAKLVAGVHPATVGSVTIGGNDVATLERPALARLVTLVTQEVHVFAGPLAADLRLARPEATDDELRDALDRVGAGAWVRALPHGLDTVVGSGGHPLSSTEAQQVALARLLLADPAVAILDEATAEAGSAGAGVLDAASAVAIEGRTSLVIAHRLTQARAADRIVVVDRGEVVEAGDHDTLVGAGGLYADLWSAWSGGRGSAHEAEVDAYELTGDAGGVGQHDDDAYDVVGPD
jgi:ATP-binding cassette subfamily C protein